MKPDQILETTSRFPRAARPPAPQPAPAPVAPIGPHRDRGALLFVSVVALTAAWLGLLAVGAGPEASPALGALALGAAYLVCVTIMLTPVFRPAQPPPATFLLALGAAAVVPVLAVVADIAGLVRVSTELVLVVTLAAVVAAGAALVVRLALGPPARAPAAAAPAPAAPPPDELEPRHGRYRLVRRLGVGGMGEVWRAEHDTLARPAALKLIKRKTLEDPKLEREMLERFRKEAEVTARLSSPHTVVLYDFGVTTDGVLYYAMELLQGMSVLALVQKYGPMKEARVAFLMRHACHSLAEAHEAGLVHRDLKPENLFVARLGRDMDFLKVLDFGLVKEVDNIAAPAGGQRRPRMQLTVAGARPGTPGFMAPEQIMGTQALDHRADIYALGCVMYFALTGTPVFRGDVESQLLFAHVDAEPDRPSQRTANPLHAGLEEVVMRCLAKDPAARPKTMDEVDRMLAALTFEPAWSQDAARAWWAAHATT